MKKSRLITMIISLLAAIALWIYVVTVVNPDGNTTLTNVPVTFSGQEALQADQNLIITKGADATVTVDFSGKELRSQEARAGPGRGHGGRRRQQDPHRQGL
jgi:YbbR domain-containing protein